MKISVKDLETTTISLPLRGSLLHAHGAHPGRFILTIVRILDSEGNIGYGEAGGGGFTLEWIFRLLRRGLIGEDPLNIRRLRWKLAHVSTATYYNQLLPQAWFAIETALLDLAGKILGVPATTLLGGAVREEVRVSGYLFPLEGLEDPSAFAKHASELVSKYGFEVLKIKAGIYTPEHEVDMVRAVAEKLPMVSIRIDPNGVWNLSQALWVLRALRGVRIEYFEDPVWGMGGMKAFKARSIYPVATNTVVTRFEDIPHALSREAVDIVLGDPHWYYGAQGYLELSSILFTLGFEVGMHSPGESGLGLAAMVAAAACNPYLGYAIDTHYIQLEDDILKSPIEIRDGRIRIPSSPGLGVEVDENKIEKYRQLYQELGDYIYHEPQRSDLAPIDTIPRTSFLECDCHRSIRR